MPLFTFARGRASVRAWPPLRRTSSSPTSAPSAGTSSSPTSTTQLRESIRALRDQGARAARGGVGGDDVPRLGLPAHGRARLPRPRQARGVRRPGRRLLLGARARRGDRRTRTPAAWPWASPSTPTWRCRRSSRSAPRSRSSEWVVPAIAGEKILCLGITEPDAGLRRRRHQDARRAATATSTSSTARRPTSPTATAPTSSCSSRRPTPTPATTASRCSSCPWTRPGVDPREEAREARACTPSDTALLAFQDVRVPDTAVLGQVGKGFYHIMWELQGERLIGAAGCVAGAQRVLRPDAPVRAGAHGVRPPDRQVPGDPPQVRRDGDEDRDGAPARLHDRLALPERRVPRARDLDGEAVRRARSRSRSPTSASRSTAAPAT